MKDFHEKLIKLHNRVVWLELIALVGFTLLMCVFISPGSTRHSLGIMLTNPLLIILNALPIAVLLALIYFICSNSFVSGGIANLVFGLMSYTNLLKIEGRDDPFVPGDFILLREALQATNEYRLDMHFGILALIILSSAAMILLGVWLGRTQKRPIAPRVVGAVLSVAVFLGCFFTVYRDKELYESFPVSSIYNVTTIFNELGFNYCFLYNFGLYSPEKPADYSEAAVRADIEAYTAAADESEPTGERPQVLMVMCEAFTDLFENEAFTYSDSEHPLRAYREVCAQPNSLTGEIVVPNFGAGTASTEFDVLTGMQTNLIRPTNISAMRTFFKDIPSTVTALADCGYDSLYLHPGDSWFYNRDSALSHIGIESRVFRERFDEETRTLDTAFLDVLCDELESRTENGEKLYTYATTIQNHQTYTYDKYDFDVPVVQTDRQLSAEAEEYLSVYGYGIKCSSEMLLELTQRLNSLDEPYVLVFFGDHLPNLGADYLSYRELGLDVGDGETAEQLVDSCTAPFLIWVNDAYLDGREASEVFAPLDLPENGRISACFLGEMALELADCESADPYFRFLYELRRELPVIKLGIVAGVDGSLSASPDDEQSALISRMHCWQYYRMTSAHKN